eukprot:4606154-Pyramimonas_sp.AAC.1
MRMKRRVQSCTLSPDCHHSKCPLLRGRLCAQTLKNPINPSQAEVDIDPHHGGGRSLREAPHGAGGYPGNPDGRARHRRDGGRELSAASAGEDNQICGLKDCGPYTLWTLLTGAQ